MRDRSRTRLPLLPALAALAAALAGCVSPGVRATVNRDPAGLEKVLERPDRGGENLDNLMSNAVQFDCVECARVLLRRGAKPNERELSAAAVAGREEMSRVLIGAGADPEAAMTAIHRDTRKWVGGCCVAPEQAETASALFKKLERERDALPAPAAPPAPAASSAAPPAASTAAVLSSDVPSFAAAARPDDYALAVGIESYDGLPKAAYAERDAESFAAYAKALGVPAKHVVVLAGPRATRSGLAKYAEGWLPNESVAGSTVYVYYAGLGAADSDGRVYLVPFDGDPQYLEQTAYPLKRLYEKLGALKAARVVVVLDAAFSGADGRSVAPKGSEPRASGADDGFNSADGKIALLAAADAGQGAGTDAASGHGLFTAAVLRGLDSAPAGDLTLKALFDSVKKAVRDEARRAGREQVPQYRSGGSATDRVVLRARGAAAP